ncbi:hypothetical protein J7T55_006053 [Diaporthe amygdali]|uniref:uncharacterized protein n=1 Tax=Phomopsis amygdali TaxID=1214568 RepID=UPI0022FE988B|nr:uncharacterized protein J7T55_006053 [Diaporthe amygdali]KAJ0124712.1 hypothetical protein J7T55_006053 [Diaporthe amygdali]
MGLPPAELRPLYVASLIEWLGSPPKWQGKQQMGWYTAKLLTQCDRVPRIWLISGVCLYVPTSHPSERGQPYRASVSQDARLLLLLSDSLARKNSSRNVYRLASLDITLARYSDLNPRDSQRRYREEEPASF